MGILKLFCRRVTQKKIGMVEEAISTTSKTYVDWPLYRQQNPITLDILRHTKCIPNHDQAADSVEDRERLLLTQVRIAGLPGWRLAYSVVEDDAGRDEEAEHDNLQKQAAEDDLLHAIRGKKVEAWWQ